VWLLQRLAEIDRELHQADAPEGDMRIEGAAVLDEYGTRKGHRERGTSGAISTSLAELDELLGSGLERGELDIVAGWTSAGKTSFIIQLAWHAAVVQGRNVVFFTSETQRPQIRVKVLARHSRLERFGLRAGLNSRDIKAGTLTPAAEAKLREVVADFSQIQGRFYIAQAPRRATIESVWSRLARITRDWPADLVVIDSIQLLRAEERRRSQWEETSATVKEVKELAGTYLDGRGVPVISPWQVSKEARAAARQRGFYLTGDLAETREAETSSDLILSLLEPDEFRGGRDVVLQLGVLKNRDGEARYGRDRGVTLDTDYATCSFTARSGGTTGASLLSGTSFGDFGGDTSALFGEAPSMGN
jgi:replicative DNA helicase